MTATANAPRMSTASGFVGEPLLGSGLLWGAAVSPPVGVPWRTASGEWFRYGIAGAGRGGRCAGACGRGAVVLVLGEWLDG
jgi:hypothetical protein